MAIVNATCFVIARNRSHVSSSLRPRARTPVRAVRPDSKESPRVRAAKKRLRLFMSTTNWRDKELDEELDQTMHILGRAGEAGIDELEKLCASHDGFLRSYAIRAIVRSGSNRGPSIVGSYMVRTKSGLLRCLVVWQLQKATQLPRNLKTAYAKIIVAEIWRCRKPRDLADENYLFDLVETLEMLDGRTYWEQGSNGGIFSEFSSEDLRRAVRRCIDSHITLSAVKRGAASEIKGVRTL